MTKHPSCNITKLNVVKGDQDNLDVDGGGGNNTSPNNNVTGVPVLPVNTKSSTQVGKGGIIEVVGGGGCEKENFDGVGGGGSNGGTIEVVGGCGIEVVAA